jgi:hypothetical protein
MGMRQPTWHTDWEARGLEAEEEPRDGVQIMYEEAWLFSRYLLWPEFTSERLVQIKGWRGMISVGEARIETIADP